MALLTVIMAGNDIILFLIFRKYLPKIMFDAADDLLGKPLVKGAMSTLGKKSGEVRGNLALEEDLALDILNSPQLEGIKLIASQFGIDIDAYIQEKGAVKTLKAAESLAGMLGMDLPTLLMQGIGGLNNPNEHVLGDNNPYLK